MVIFGDMRPCLILCFLLLQVCLSRAQQVPIGQWREHLPYGQARAVVTGNDKVYCATPYNMFSADLDDHEITRYNKLNGLHDAGISTIGTDNAGQVLIAYQNGNLDLLRDAQVYNLPDILRKNIQADKTIYSIFFHEGMAWVATGFGIVVMNTDRLETADTYIIGSSGQYLAVYAVTEDDGYFYAATAEGMKRAAATGSNLANYRNWEPVMQGLQPAGVQQVVTLAGRLICRQRDSLFYRDQDSWKPWYADGWQPVHLAVHEQELLICEQRAGEARIVRLQPTGTVTGVIQHNLVKMPLQAAGDEQSIWIADARNGLLRYNNNSLERLLPNSPAGIVAGQLLFHNNTLWATAGAVTDSWTATGNSNGYYTFSQEEWHNFNDTLRDLLPVAADPASNTVYIGSFGNGLLVLGADGSRNVIRQPQLPGAIDDPTACRVSGLAADAAGNLWLTAYGADRNVLVKKPDNSWISFRIPFAHTYNAVSDILIDDLDQKWIISPRGNGLFAFNHGASLESTADDHWKLYRSAAGQGNLPSNDVRCLAKDKDGWIWIGTGRGVAIITCAGEAFSNGCEAYLPIVQQGNFAGYLFRDQQVNAVAVDGANRKWVGTQNGVWLISASGEKILEHFNAANSPLPDDVVSRIAIHPATGEVFFATRQGLVSYRGTATEGLPEMKKDSVLVFPNPVTSGYSGSIAIRGLLQNALVKITDISGRLVFENRAQGGQAVWSGKDYTGHRPQSGIYLVFATDNSGKEKLVTKIVFIR